jgi:hypothetical protein
LGIGKILVIIGSVIIVIGLILIFSPQIPFLGKLPGDITVKKEGFSFYFPVVTFLIISIVLTIVINIILRIIGK